MSPVAKGLAVVMAASALVAASAATTPEPSATSPPLPTCIVVQTDARYVPYGYNHVVILTNSCAIDATCIVTTDVNPTPLVAVVPAGTTKELLTFMGSPHPAFVATVSCELRTPHT